MSGMTTAVAKAIEELRSTFEGSVVQAEPDGSGGAEVVVRNVPLGPPYDQGKVWFGFRITSQYPYADVYPHFTNAELARTDGAGLGGGFGSATFRDGAAIQISRASNGLNPETDTAALKLLKVRKWMLERT